MFTRFRRLLLQQNQIICKVMISQIIHDYTSQLCFLLTLWMVTLCLKWCPLLSLRLVIIYQNDQYTCLLSGEGFRMIVWISGLCSTTVPLAKKFSIRFMPKIVGFTHSWVHKSPKTLWIAYWQNGLKSGMSSH